MVKWKGVEMRSASEKKKIKKAIAELKSLRKGTTWGSGMSIRKAINKGRA